MTHLSLKAPFPWFGGKALIAAQVWQWLGDVPNFVEPFFGSGAVLLSRPGFDARRHLETVNDLDGMVANFWRALQSDPEQVARYADWPVNENDLHARHAWLVGQKASLQARLEGDPDWYDVQSAGWWVWGLACWIGSGFCSGKGPWQQVDGQLVHLSGGRGVHRQLVHLGNGGRGVRRRLVHLGDKGQGVQRQRVHLGNAGQGVHRQLVHLGDGGLGVHRQRVAEAGGLVVWMQALADRLRRVRVCCGDWTRVLGPSPTTKQGLTGVFLDPPYGEEVGREMGVYAQESGTVARLVRAWCLAHGADPLLRIVLCGYGAEHDSLLAAGWSSWIWKAPGGYGQQGNGRGKANRHRETCWISPHCCSGQQQEVLPFG